MAEKVEDSSSSKQQQQQHMSSPLFGKQQQRSYNARFVADATFPDGTVVQ